MGLRADLQKLVLFFAAGGSVFLVAMALGMRSLPFLVGASVALLATVTAVVVVVLRSRPAPPEPGPDEPVRRRTLAVHLHEEFVDLDLKLRLPVGGRRTSPPGGPTSAPPPGPQRSPSEEPATERLAPQQRSPSEPAERSNGHDPYGYDPADFETARLAPSTTIDPLDSEIEPIILPDAEVPQPRAEPTVRLPESAAARGGTGLDAALPVADLARSVRFYRGVLGLTVTDSTTDGAVVESDGLRLLLDRVEDPAARAPRIGAVHLEVTDIDDTCRLLRDLEVPVIEPPTLVAPGVWRARLRDPDGHEVELLEFREP